MSDRDVEAMLAELKPAGLSQDADQAVLAAIRSASIEQGAPTQESAIMPPVYSRPIPAWAAAAACLVIGTAAWIAGSHARTPVTVSRSPIDVAPYSAALDHPSVHRVHVETDVFAATPRRGLDVHNWSPQSGVTRENRS